MPDRTCTIDGCGKKVLARGWCSGHYQRWQAHGDPMGSEPPRSKIICSEEGCNSNADARGLCGRHYQQRRREGRLPEAEPRPTTCMIGGCSALVYGHGLCRPHYARQRAHGTPHGRADLEPVGARPPHGEKWCRRCMTYLPESDFYTGKRGPESPCKACRATREKKKRQDDPPPRRPTPASLAPPGTKWCNACKTYLPPDLFHESRTKKSGLAGYCRSCTAIRQRRMRMSRAANEARRRAKKRGRDVEVYSRLDIAERDGWRCQLCGKRIGRSYSWPHPRSLSIDHVVPLSRGGHDTKSNVQASHLVCNLRKNAGGVGQLRLIG